MPLKHLPLLFPLAFFVLGIIIAAHFSISYPTLLAILSACILLVSFGKSLTLKGLSIWFIFSVLGIFIVKLGDAASNTSHFSSNEASELRIKVGNSKRTKKGYAYEANVIRADSTLSRGKIMIYSDSTFTLIPYYTYIIPGKYSRYEKYDNPGHFDYGSYLASRRIFHRSYLSDMPPCIREPRLFEYIIASSGEFIASHFTESFKLRGNSDLVNAILLGRKADMDNKARKLFVNNGLAHLLAISGMHVGIIFMILNFLLAAIPIPFLRKLLILCGIWFYVVMTGMQVPAIRAAFMLSVFVLGQLSNRNVKGLNSIFTAALVMLAINPSMIYQVSFQMSFAAMCSIMIFYRPILNLYQTEQRWLSHLWKLTALNISVQFFVLPIAIFYFKQVPTYSLITSLISIPFIVAIMWGALISLALFPLNFVSTFVDNILESLINFYLSLLEAFSKLPYALLSNVEIHYIQVIFWFIGSLSFILLYHMNSQKISRYFMSFIPLVAISSLLSINASEESSVVVYDAKEGIVIDYLEKNKTTRYSYPEEALPYFLKSDIPDREAQLEDDRYIHLPNLKLHVISNEDDLKEVIKAHICILNNSSLVDPRLERILNQNCDQIIIPRHLPVDQVPKGYYHISKHGAFKLEL